MRHLGKNLVIIACLLSAGAFAAYLVLRPRIPAGNGFFDGKETLSAGEIREQVRLARWDQPEVLLDGFGSGRLETDPAFDADSGRVFFASGERGHDQDLWMVEPRPGQEPLVRPLDEVNTAADECGPTYRDGFLYFASDRGGGQGGFDLYRARWSAGGLGTPENLGPAINSEQDDLDPALRPVSRELYFVSNRDPMGSADFDLYLCRMQGEEISRALPVEALASPYQELSPSFDPRGQVLVFASDRPGGEGGFDLYRSLWRHGDWDTPQNLGTPNSGSDERGAAIADGGFTLYFSSSRFGSADLFVAHTRELYPLPPSGFTLLDFTLLFVLLLVALLAYLARRWETLDIIYKCVLLSLLLHLVILWLAQRVDIEVAPSPAGPGDSVYEVQLLADLLDTVSRMEDRARGDSVAELVPHETRTHTARSQLAATAPATAMAAPRSMARAAPAQAAAPPATAWQHAARYAASVPLPAVETPGEAFERHRGEATALRVEAGEHPVEPTRVSGAATRQVAAVGPVAAAEPSPAAAMPRPVSTAPSPAAPRPADRPSREPAALAFAADAAVPTRVPGDRREVPRQGATASLQVAAGTVSVHPAVPRTGPERSALPAAEAPPTLAARRPASPSLERPVTALAAPVEPAAPGGHDRARAVHHDVAVAPSTPSDRIETAHERSLSAGAVVLHAPTPASLSASPSDPPAAHEPRRWSSPAGPPERPTPPPLVLPGRVTRVTDAARERAPSLERQRSERILPLPAIAGRHDRMHAPEAAGRAASLAPPSPRAIPPLARRSEASPPPLAGPRRASLVVADQAAQPAPLRIEPPRTANSRAEIPVGPRLPKLYERRVGDLKEVALREGGGSRETEAAVQRGLEYLASVQRRLGYFGDRGESSMEDKYGDVRIGKTGLALLAFLGAGHTPISNTEFSNHVQKAIHWLLDMQHEASGHFGQCNGYGHGIATYALAECYAMTGMKELQRPLDLAVAHIVAVQKKGSPDARLNGGWTYYYRDGPGYDSYPRTSISSWQVMALKSAGVGGLEVSPDVLDAARRFFQGCYDAEYGYFRYNHDRDWLRSSYRTLPASTPASIFCLNLLGERSGPMLDRTSEWVMDRRPRRYRYPGDDAFVHRGEGNLYFWYYGTLAMYLRGGQDWRDWNESMKQTLLPAQRRDGSWQPISNYAQGIAGDDPEEATYTTALCVLSLEIYYRYFTPLLRQP